MSKVTVIDTVGAICTVEAVEYLPAEVIASVAQVSSPEYGQVIKLVMQLIPLIIYLIKAFKKDKSDKKTIDGI